MVEEPVGEAQRVADRSRTQAALLDEIILEVCHQYSAGALLVGKNIGHCHCAPCWWSSKDNAEQGGPFHVDCRSCSAQCGIIRVTALWPLCRYRHNGHWTGHCSRLDRNLKNRFGSAAYAAEELIAELSSAILGAELGLPVTHLDNHASYIDHWLKLLRDDDRAILTAAARAEEASALLLKLGGREIETGYVESMAEAA